MYHGIINVYKEAGCTSFDVIARLRTILGQRKIGHTGTLDPGAKGVLPVCLGVATKTCDFLVDHTKTYRAVLLLGVTTDTEDIFGQVLESKEVQATEAEVEDAVLSFIGTYEQLPPMYSAIKVNGQKLCDVARSGRQVERKTRNVDILDIRIENISLPEVTFEVRCGRGTYIRSLCRDIGEKLGCGGCMKELERTAVGMFEKKDALRLDQIRTLHRIGTLQQYLVKTDALFAAYRQLQVLPEGDRCLYNGNPVPWSVLPQERKNNVQPQEIFRMYFSDTDFAGLYRTDRKQLRLYPEKMFLETLSPVYRSVAVGKFDGCHKGHRALFQKLQEIAEETGTESMLLVIDTGGTHILSEEERFLCASEYGIRHIETIPMDPAFMRMTPEDFVKDIIVQRFHTRHLVVGSDFRFGRERSGDVAFLQEAGARYDFISYVVEEQQLDGRKISSSWIREELSAGHLEKAKQLLGSDYKISGFVIHGNRIGHRLQIPTINLSCVGKARIPFGVYVITAATETERFAGIANYGVKPTVSGGEDILLEANLFDCDEDLYGRFVEVTLLSFVRPEQKFESLDALAAQIRADIACAKESLKEIDIQPTV